MNNNIKSFIAGEDGASVGKVELTNGETLPCDIAILGVGVISNTEWLKSSSVLVTPEGTIPVNEVQSVKYQGNDSCCNNFFFFSVLANKREEHFRRWRYR